MTLLTLWCGLKGQYTIGKHDFLVLAFNNLFSLSALKDDYTGIPFPPKHIAPVCIQYTPTPPPLTWRRYYFQGEGAHRERARAEGERERERRL